MRTSMKLSQSARAGQWVGACAVVLAVAMGGMSCAERREVRASGEHALTSAAIPEGFAWNPDDPRPANVPIDLSTPGGFARSVCEPMVIDTRAFPVQVQEREGAAPVQLVKAMLPPHTRPAQKSVEGVVPEDRPGAVLPTVRTVPVAAFPGMGQTPLSPPDLTIAVGPEHIVQTVNSDVAFYKKDGTLLFRAPMDSTGGPGFFEVVGASTFVFDPKCLYDHVSGRFVIIALEVYGTTQSFIDIAVSDDSDPTGVWYRYRTNSVIAGSGGMIFWADYPGLGFDDGAIYVVSNLFGLNNPNFGGTLFRIFPKAGLLEGEPITFTDMVAPTTISVQVAESYGANAAPYFVSVADNTRMQVQTIDDPLGTPGLRTVLVDVPPFVFPTGLSPTPGGNLGTLDGRLMNVTARDASLFFAHSVRAGSRMHVRWYEVDARGWPHGGEGPTLTQSGTVDLGGSLHTIFPAIHQNRHGDIGMVFGTTSATTNPGLYIAGRRAGDAPGAMGPPVSAVTSTTAAPGRWGDYFDITTDPNDDATFWYVGEYHHGGLWRTWIGSFVVTCAANVNGDADLDASDFLDYMDAFGACEAQPGPCVSGGVDADFNGDTLVDILDFLAFLDAYGRGC